MYIQNNGKVTVLTKDQLKRLRGFMVQVEYVSSLAAARKKTQNPKQQKDCVEYLYTSIDNSSDGLLEDIYDLYLEDDEPVQESKPIDEKLSNTIDKRL